MTASISNGSRSITNASTHIPNVTTSIVNASRSIANVCLYVANVTASISNRPRSITIAAPSIANVTASITNRSPHIRNASDRPSLSLELRLVKPLPINHFEAEHNSNRSGDRSIEGKRDRYTRVIVLLD